jgi:hypothetical protein
MFRRQVVAGGVASAPLYGGTIDGVLLEVGRKKRSNMQPRSSDLLYKSV